MQIYQLGKTWFSEQAGGGSDRVFSALMRHLPTPTTSVNGVVVGPVPRNGATVPGVTGVSNDTDGLLTRWWALRRHVRNQFLMSPPDVVAAHFALYAAPVLDLLPDHRPFVVHFHGPWAEESRQEGETGWKVSLKKQLEKAVYRQADHFIVLSTAFRDLLVQHYDVSPDRVSIIPGGVDTQAFNTGLSRRAARQQLGWPLDRPTVLSVRRLVHRVGLEPLIRSIDALRTHIPDLLLLIAGKGPLHNELQALIEAHDLGAHVRLLGFVPDDALPLAYRAADLSIMPTQALEGFGLSAVESLAAGTPVLVTPVGGLPDIVRDLSPNLILEGTDEDALASHLSAALTGTRPLPSSAACQAHATTHFDWPTVTTRIRSLYRSLQP